MLPERSNQPCIPQELFLLWVYSALGSGFISKKAEFPKEDSLSYRHFCLTKSVSLCSESSGVLMSTQALFTGVSSSLGKPECKSQMEDFKTFSDQLARGWCNVTQGKAAGGGSPRGRGGSQTPGTWGHLWFSDGTVQTLPPSGKPSHVCVPCSERHQHPKGLPTYLQECFLLLQMLADHWSDMVCLRVGAQLVSSSTPVLFSLVLLLQALEDTADLWAEELQAQSRPVRHRSASLASVAGHMLGTKVLAWGPRPSEGTMGSVLSEDKCRGQSRQ